MKDPDLEKEGLIVIAIVVGLGVIGFILSVLFP